MLECRVRWYVVFGQIFVHQELRMCTLGPEIVSRVGIKQRKYWQGHAEKVLTTSGVVKRCGSERIMRATSQAQLRVEGTLLLDVVVTQSAAILDLDSHIVDGFAGLDLEGDGLYVNGGA